MANPEIDLDELALIADWLFRHPETQGASEGIYRVTDNTGLDLIGVYDEEAAAHDVLEGSGISAELLEYPGLRDAIVEIIDRSSSDTFDIYRQRLKVLRAVWTNFGHIAASQMLAPKAVIDPKE
jgi:hypothetical protein